MHVGHSALSPVHSPYSQRRVSSCDLGDGTTGCFARLPPILLNRNNEQGSSSYLRYPGSHSNSTVFPWAISPSSGSCVVPILYRPPSSIGGKRHLRGRHAGIPGRHPISKCFMSRYECLSLCLSHLPDFLPHFIRFLCGGASSNPSSQVTFKIVPNVCSMATSCFWALELRFPPTMTSSFTKLGSVKGGHGDDSERRPCLL